MGNGRQVFVVELVSKSYSVAKIAKDMAEYLLASVLIL